MFPINKFSIKTVSENDTEGVFEIGPLPKGYGNTIGTTYRRLLLSSIPGAAITSVKINDAQHEYTALAGLEDDVLAIILALKGVAVVSHTDDPVTLKLQVKGIKSGPKEVTAADLEKNPMIELINPDYVITTLADEKSEINAEVTIERGLGYSLPDEDLRQEAGVIPVDGIFTPVRRVSINVTNTRVGQQTDLDLVELRMLTDGTITPSAALFQAAEILVKLSEHLLRSAEDLLSGKSKDQAAASMIPVERETPEEQDEEEPILIEDLDISTRLRNALTNAGYKDLIELEGLTEEELKNAKGMGEKSFEELADILSKHNVKLI